MNADNIALALLRYTEEAQSGLLVFLRELDCIAWC